MAAISVPELEYGSPLTAVLPESRDKRTNASRKRLQNSLPRVFYAAVEPSRRIIGTVLIVRAVKLQQSFSVVLLIGGGAYLVNPITVESTSWQCQRSVSRLKPFFDNSFRSCQATCGGSLQHNFIDFTQEWRVLHIDAATADALMSSHPPSHIPGTENIARAMCIDLENCQSLADVLPNLDVEYQCPPDGATSGTAEQEPTRPDQDFNTSSGGDALTGRKDAERALERLNDIAIPTAGGVITHHYEPIHVIMNYLYFGPPRLNGTITYYDTNRLIYLNTDTEYLYTFMLIHLYTCIIIYLYTYS